MGPISSRQSPFVAGASPNVKKPVKMVMCVNFNNSGHCDRGETCTYAHGLDELHEYRMKQVRRTNVFGSDRSSCCLSVLHKEGPGLDPQAVFSALFKLSFSFLSQNSEHT